MAWSDGVDRAVNYIITSANWNALLGAAGSLMQLKNHAHGGTTGEGSQSLGPLVKADFNDDTAPAAPGAGKTRIYSVSGLPRFRSGAAGADTALVHDGATAGGDLLGTYPNPTVSKLTLGSDADGDMYYRAAGVLARLAKGTASQSLRMNAGATAPEWVTGAIDNSEVALGADVQVAVANTFYDIVSLSLAAGTWFIQASILCDIDGTRDCTLKLWDGTTVESSAQIGIGYAVSGNWRGQVPLVGLVVLGGTTTMKVSGTATVAGTFFRAAAPHNGAGNNASRMVAIKVA